MSGHIAVIGAGYVGMTTAACLAHRGHVVLCADIDEEKVELLIAGAPVFHESEIGELVLEGLSNGRLSLGTSNAWAVTGAELTFLCLPTPPGFDGSPDAGQVEAVVKELAGELRSDSVLCVRSTLPVGATSRITLMLGRWDVDVAYNPEFLREGSAVKDFLDAPRVVVGTESQDAVEKILGVLRPPSDRVLRTDPATAEVLKLASNAFLATKLSFVNALAAVCEGVGADVRVVATGLGMDPRIGAGFLSPGPGWGGPCLHKDTVGLIRAAEESLCDSSLFKSALTVNEAQVTLMVEKVVKLAGGSVAGKRVALLGVSYKAGTADLRGSPALALAERLAAMGASVVAYDPSEVGPLGPLGPLEAATLVADPYAACAGATVTVVATEWDEIRTLDYSRVGSLMAEPAVVDCRNLLEPETLRRAGFRYEGIGLPPGS